MRAVRTGMVLSLTVLAASCGRQEGAVVPNRTSSVSADRVTILSVTPGIDAVLQVGQKVPVKVEVEYVLSSAASATITLVIQQGEQGHEPLANETHVIQRGAGKLVLTKDIEVPDTNTIQIFTPLSPQGATRTTVVDTRAYGVAKK